MHGACDWIIVSNIPMSCSKYASYHMVDSLCNQGALLWVPDTFGLAYSKQYEVFKHVHVHEMSKRTPHTRAPNSHPHAPHDASSSAASCVSRGHFVFVGALFPPNRP